VALGPRPMPLALCGADHCCSCEWLQRPGFRRPCWPWPPRQPVLLARNLPQPCCTAAFLPQLRPVLATAFRLPGHRVVLAERTDAGWSGWKRVVRQARSLGGRSCLSHPTIRGLPRPGGLHRPGPRGACRCWSVRPTGLISRLRVCQRSCCRSGPLAAGAGRWLLQVVGTRPPAVGPERRWLAACRGNGSETPDSAVGRGLAPAGRTPAQLPGCSRPVEAALSSFTVPRAALQFACGAPWHQQRGCAKRLEKAGLRCSPIRIRSVWC